MARGQQPSVHRRGVQDRQTESGRAAARTEGHQATCRAAAVLGGHWPRSEGNLASDNEQPPTIDTPPQEPVAQEKTAERPARDVSSDRTPDKAEETAPRLASQERHARPPRAERPPHRQTEKNDATKADVPVAASAGPAAPPTPPAPAVQANGSP